MNTSENNIKINCYTVKKSLFPGTHFKREAKYKTVIFYFSPKHFESQVNNFWLVLSSEEKERAQKFHFPRDKNNYIVCHALLRLVIAQTLNLPPSEIIIHTGSNNKPYLEGNSLYFNLSHTEGTGAIAISEKNSIGIDVEKINPAIDYAAIYGSHYTKEEQKLLKGTSNPEECFYLLWTRKEALLKAIGIGLHTDLQQINVGGRENSIHKSAFTRHSGAMINNSYSIYSKKMDGCFLSVACPDKSAIDFVNLTGKNITQIL